MLSQFSEEFISIFVDILHCNTTVGQSNNGVSGTQDSIKVELSGQKQQQKEEVSTYQRITECNNCNDIIPLLQITNSSTSFISSSVSFISSNGINGKANLFKFGVCEWKADSVEAMNKSSQQKQNDDTTELMNLLYIPSHYEIPLRDMTMDFIELILKLKKN